MHVAVRRAPPRPFTPPSGVVMASVERDTGRRMSFWCSGGTIIEEAFRAGTEPPADCDVTLPARAVEGILGWFRGLFR
jgi:membrane carboxypeptidase/penicillin-binding protein